jgi:predicted metal-dependent hydrolase
MHNTIQYENYCFHIVHNSKLKHTYLSVSKEGELSIKTPHRNEKLLYKFIEEKKGWIAKQIDKVASLQTLDEEIHTLAYLQSRAEHFSALMGLEYEMLKFRKMRSRWGSCSSKKIITLNKELLKVDKELVDYVVVHELAHLVHMNHSKQFHDLVQTYLPDARRVRKELQNIKIA